MVVAIAVVISMSVVVSAAATADGRNSHVRGLVLFVGDSNLTLSSQAIELTLASSPRGDNGYVSATASRIGSTIRTYDCLDPTACATTDYWQTRLGELLPKLTPDAVVTELGVNDTVGPGTETTPGYAKYTKKIEWFMSLFPPTTPVIWTNVPCNLLPPPRLTACTTINYALTVEKARIPNLTVVDWNYASYGHVEYMVAPGTDVHLSPAGQNAWANLVLNALDNKFPA
jgi:lysophospholipase L1-like esterase